MAEKKLTEVDESNTMENTDKVVGNIGSTVKQISLTNFVKMLKEKIGLSDYQTKTDENLTTTSKEIVGAINENKDSIDNLSDEIVNIGTPTDEQIDSAVTKYLAQNPVSGGLTNTAKNLLITILRNAVYTNDQSQNITSLESAISGATGTTYTITNSLTNVSNSNGISIIEENSSYSATLTANDGYTLDNVIITMGGVDITSSAYSNGIISITSVTGNIVITANAIESTTSSDELITDGLVAYFDFRNATYNNEGSGGSTTIQPTQGSGQLFTWQNNVVTDQNEYGMITIRGFSYDKNGGTTLSDCGTSFTWVFKCYLTSLSSPMFSNDYAGGSNITKLNFRPKYNNTSSSTTQVTSEAFGTRISNAYDLVFLVVDENICKLYFGNELIKEVDGSTIEDFVSWYDKLTFSILGSNASGYFSQLAIYNKALSDVEITEMKAYLETLEVSA